MILLPIFFDKKENRIVIAIAGILFGVCLIYAGIHNLIPRERLIPIYSDQSASAYSFSASSSNLADGDKILIGYTSETKPLLASGLFLLTIGLFNLVITAIIFFKKNQTRFPSIKPIVNIKDHLI
jgi:hypothetical protein